MSFISLGEFGSARALDWHSLLNSLHHLEILALETPYSAVVAFVGMIFFFMKTYNLLFKFRRVTWGHK